MKTNNILNRTVLFLLSLIVFCSCAGRNIQRDKGVISHYEMDSMRNSWRDYNVRGEYDSLITTTLPVYRRALVAGDTIPLLYTGTFIAQSYLFKENIDSVNYYLSYISSYLDECKDVDIKAIYNIVYGCYLLKSDLDYSEALSAFYEALKYAEEGGDVNNQLVVLANISNIFYTRSDRHGIEYARKAYEIAQSPSVDDYPRCQAYLVMAQMLQLSEEYQSMLMILDQVERIVESRGYASLSPHISIIYAGYYRAVGNYELADSSYKSAIYHSSLTEPSIASYIYMQYGDFCLEQGKTEDAIKSYKSGLEISYINRNTEFRANLLQKLSDVYSKIGDKATSIEYVDALRDFKDSMSTNKKEMDFNNLLLSYQKMEHNNEIQKKELDLLKSNRRLTILACIILVVLVLSASFTTLYFRQRRMYRTLVLQHQSYLQRLSPKKAEDNNVSKVEDTGVQDYERDLFMKIENLMKDSGIYHQKDLSLDSIAELLATNRTYVSKAINTFAGVSFYAYLDFYRIREATELISSSDIPFKQMADDLGYNSVSVFYKAFKKETGCTPGRYRDEMKRIKLNSPIDNP